MKLDDLSQAIIAYRGGSLPLDAFEDWFRTSSRGMFGESTAVLEACLDVEAAFSMLRFGGTIAEFQEELANAIRPFVYADPIEVVVGIPRVKPTSASFAYRWTVAAA